MMVDKDFFFTRGLYPTCRVLPKLRVVRSRHVCFPADIRLNNSRTELVNKFRKYFARSACNGFDFLLVLSKFLIMQNNRFLCLNICVFFDTSRIIEIEGILLY